MYRVPWLALALALALADLERAVVQADERARPAGGHALLVAYPLSLHTVLPFTARGYQAECQARVIPRGLLELQLEPRLRVPGLFTRRNHTTKCAAVRRAGSGVRAVQRG